MIFSSPVCGMMWRPYIVIITNKPGHKVTFIIHYHHQSRSSWSGDASVQLIYPERLVTMHGHLKPRCRTKIHHITFKPWYCWSLTQSFEAEIANAISSFKWRKKMEIKRNRNIIIIEHLLHTLRSVWVAFFFRFKIAWELIYAPPAGQGLQFKQSRQNAKVYFSISLGFFKLIHCPW